MNKTPWVVLGIVIVSVAGMFSPYPGSLFGAFLISIILGLLL